MRKDRRGTGAIMGKRQYQSMTLARQVVAVLLLLPMLGGILLAQAGDDAASPLVQANGRSRFVHWLNIYDADGKPIMPGEAGVMSSARTCGKCHTYDVVGSGHHFNANQGVDPGRPGEPWILADAATGTQLPLSYRKWKGVFQPGQVGMSEWDFTVEFARHFPGGGVGEPSQAEMDKSPAAARWKISGGLQIDCMTCHYAGGGASPPDLNERSKQVERQNFLWTLPAEWGLGVVQGEAKKTPDDFDPNLPPDPDHPGSALPVLTYNKNRFDANGRVLFDVTRTPPAERCYACHTTRETRLTSGGPRFAHDGDVHIQRGMKCTDCHRNALDHEITRGYEWELRKGEAATLSCAGCHLGEDGKGNVIAGAGRMHAPVPAHAGLPPIHMKALTCTACHAGPVPDAAGPVLVQTSLAHGLGIVRGDRSNWDVPYIEEPVFRKGEDGKIGPHRVMWPAYWGYLKGGKVEPISPKVAAKFVGPGPARTAEAATQPAEMTKERIGAVLKRMDAGAVYVAAGKMYSLKSGAVAEDAVPDVEGSGEYAWAVGHDVRPASQALGARGCTECHASGSVILGSKVTAIGPWKMEGASPAVTPMWKMAGIDEDDVAALSAGYSVRPLAKAVIVLAGAVIALVLIVYGLQGAKVLLRSMGSPRDGEGVQ